MADATTMMNVRHRVGWFGKLTIQVAHYAHKFGIKFPSIGLLCWIVNRSSYVSVDYGPWQRIKLDITPAEFDQ